jgi:flagellar basal-body rod modification protein FlgD
MAAGITGTTSGATSTTGSSTKTSDAATLAGNFTQFLTLLTTQLKNQNPLDPLDTNQFTQELVQFSSVEQQLKTNDTLSQLLTASKTSAASTASSFLGKTITADGATSQLTNGAATWTLNAARAAKTATITILDANGNVVATKAQALSSGSQIFAWDGRTTAGATAADGKYTIKIAATDATGSSIDVSTKASGTVTSVDVSGSEPTLLVNGQSLPVSSVTSIGTGS